MPLSAEQKQALEAEAKKRGIDPAKLIAVAEKTVGSPDQKPGDATTGEKPKLFMYLLPFVTVREVRQNWLGLSDSFAGDSEVASKWAAEMGGGSPSPVNPADESA